MNEPEIGNLLVEFYLANAHVFGVVLRVQVEEGQRLIDVLGSGDEMLELRAANVRFAAGGDTRTFETFVLKKSEILIAIPRETNEQIHDRAMFRTGISSATSGLWSIGLLLPPLYIEGAVTKPSVMAKRLSVDSLDRFFIVTGADVWTPGGVRQAEPFVVANRDGVSAVGHLDEANADFKMEAPLSYAPRREA